MALRRAASRAAARPAATRGDNTKKAEESKKNSAKIDVAKAGDVTLTIWDQEVRGGQAAQIKRLNAAFLAKYPNVKIKRVAKSFTDLQTTLKLAVSSNKAPDIVEANQGRPIMGQLVKGGLLKPLDAYADAYGWKDRWSKTLLDLNRFSADGKQFGAGNLYGVSQQGEIVGVFYNKDKVETVPRRSPSSRQMLAKAKRDGEVPISFGNLDKFGGIHEFQTVQNAFAGKQATRDFVFAKDGASFDTPENREAAAKLQEWADKGYFTPDFNGTGYDPAWQQFTKGKGPFTIAGTWITNDASKALGDKLGFFLMPGREAGSDPVVARRREPAVGDHGEVEARRRGGRLHRLPHQRRGRRRAGRDRQPAGDGGERRSPPSRGRRRTSSPPGRSSATATASRRTWTTPRRRSTTTSPAPCRSCWRGKAQAGRVHEGRAGGLREVHRRAE